MNKLLLLLVGCSFYTYAASSSSSSSESLSRSSSSEDLSFDDFEVIGTDQVRRDSVVKEAKEIIGKPDGVDFQLKRDQQRKKVAKIRGQTDRLQDAMSTSIISKVVVGVVPGASQVVSVGGVVLSGFNKILTGATAVVGKYRDLMQEDLTEHERVLFAFLKAERDLNEFESQNPSIRSNVGKKAAKYLVQGQVAKKTPKSNLYLTHHTLIEARNKALDELEIKNLGYKRGILQRTIDLRVENNEHTMHSLAEKQQYAMRIAHQNSSSKEAINTLAEITEKLKVAALTEADMHHIHQDVKTIENAIYKVRHGQDMQEQRDEQSTLNDVEKLKRQVAKLKGHIRFIHHALFREYKLTPSVHAGTELLPPHQDLKAQRALRKSPPPARPPRRGSPSPASSSSSQG